MRNSCKDCGNEYPKTCMYNGYTLCSGCASKRLALPGPYSVPDPGRPVASGKARPDLRERTMQRKAAAEKAR